MADITSNLDLHLPLDDNAPSPTVVAAVGTNATLVGGDDTEDIDVGAGNGPGGSLADNGLDLDGSADYVNAGAQAAYDGTSTFSVAGWVWFDATPTAFHFIAGDQKQSPTLTGWRISNGDSSNRRKFVFLLVETVTTAQVFKQTSANVFTGGEWIHVAATYSGVLGAGGVTLYVNGAAAADTSSGTIPGAVTVAGAVSVGARHEDAGGKVDGKVADFRFYGRVSDSGPEQTRHVAPEGEHREQSEPLSSRTTSHPMRIQLSNDSCRMHSRRPAESPPSGNCVPREILSIVDGAAKSSRRSCELQLWRQIRWMRILRKHRSWNCSIHRNVLGLSGGDCWSRAGRACSTTTC